MHITNKFLRLIVSVFVTLLLYFLLALIVSDGIADTIETMILFAVFGLFIVGPTLIFITYVAHHFLTEKSKRSKRAPNIFKIMVVFVIIMALLYVATMYTDLFG